MQQKLVQKDTVVDQLQYYSQPAPLIHINTQQIQLLLGEKVANDVEDHVFSFVLLWTCWKSSVRSYMCKWDVLQ